MRARAKCALMLAVILTLALLCGFSYERAVLLPVIMYHNVVPDGCIPNKYEITVSKLEEDFKYLRDNGFTPISADILIAYCRGAKIALPEKPVLITFDDGFYNYNKYLPAILEKYETPCIVSVVGSFTRYNKRTDACERYIYMDYDDIRELSESPYVTIASHSYALHSLKGRNGVKRKAGESEEEYSKIFNLDCDKQEGILEEYGINLSCYTYPFGSFCRESERIIKERGYAMSLTCEERVNYLRPEPKSLYLMGRFNRDGRKDSIKDILVKCGAIK